MTDAPSPLANPFDLRGKVGLVTGGNGGIGLGFARGLARAGADIAIWGMNERKNTAAKEALAIFGTRVEVLKCDVGSEAAIESGFAQTLDLFGRVDGVYANAGVGGVQSPFERMELNDWQNVMRINLDGVFLTFRAAARHMVGRDGGGVMVVTSSMGALMGTARNEHYGSSKGAVISMIRGLAVEYAKRGIRAHAVLPGWVETEMTEGLFGNERFAGSVMPRMPMRRWGNPADFEGIAVYLMSDASRWHTGDCFLIDGGYSLF